MLAKYEPTVFGRKLAEPKSMRSWDGVKADIPARSSAGMNWYLVHCAGMPQEKVMECVKGLGWKMCIPICKELRAVPKRELTASQRNNPFPIKRPTDVPLFPRYPFLYFDLCDPMRHEIFSRLGVQGMICDGSGDRAQPLMVDPAIIKTFDAMKEKGTIPLGTTVRQLAYKLQETVRIIAGPFTGFDAVVDEVPDVPLEKLDETARLRLLVSMFRRETVVELTLADIEKL